MDGKQSDLAGAVVIVTGANSGIGKAAAKAFAVLGAHVVLACRSIERGQAVQSEFAADGLTQTTLLQIDLADLESVRAFAEAVQARFDRVDALVNNAGLLARRRSLTKQGFESSFGVNYLGHFLLTLLLLPLLERAKQGRVVMMSSLAHAWGDVDLDDLNDEAHYDRFRAYGRSKLCNILFARYAAERLRARGSRVTINAVHPGIVASNIVVNRRNNSLWWVAKLSRLVLLSPEQGADTCVWLVCEASLASVSGEYFRKRRVAASSPASHNMDIAAQLYSKSLAFVGMDEDPLAFS